MNDYISEDARLAVKRGAEWFESRGHYLWPHKILDAVAEGRFFMASCDSCAVGVTLGDFYDYFATASGVTIGDKTLERKSHEEAIECGFSIDERTPYEESADLWTELERAWIALANERLGR